MNADTQRNLKISSANSQSEVSTILDKHEIFIWRRETADERESRLRIAEADARCKRIMGIVISGVVLGLHLIVTAIGIAILLFASSPAKLNGAALVLAALLTSPLVSQHLSRK